VTATATAAALHRILLTSPMKSGSTYTAQVVARYLDVEPMALEYDWLAEQNLTHELLEQLRGRDFVLGLHMRPHGGNLAALHVERMHAVVTWRNLADVIVSFDDHAVRYGAHNPVFYVDHDAFMRMPAAQRHRYLIERIVPWNLGFYLSWRRLPHRALFSYEHMVWEPVEYFAAILRQCGVPFDAARLDAAMDGDAAAARFNRGVVGRGAELFDRDTQRMLERLVVDHPEFEQIEVLLWELPWEPREIGRISDFDGTTVRGSNAELAYFVSRGIRHEVSTPWMASRATAALRVPQQVADGALAALPEGRPLF
jgi:hypothetical protein